MAFCPRCFRWMCDMPSGPVEEVFLVPLIAFLVMVGVNGDGMLWSISSAWSRCSMALSSLLCGSLQVLA